MPPIASPPRRGWGKTADTPRTAAGAAGFLHGFVYLGGQASLVQRSLELAGGGRVQVRRLIADQTWAWRLVWRRFFVSHLGVGFGDFRLGGSGFSRQVCCLSARPLAQAFSPFSRFGFCLWFWLLAFRFFTSAGLGSGLLTGAGIGFAGFSAVRLGAAGLCSGAGAPASVCRSQAPAPPPGWSPAAWLEQQALPQAVGFSQFCWAAASRARFGRSALPAARVHCPAQPV